MNNYIDFSRTQYTEAYEDNGGNLFLCLFDADDNCLGIFEGFEYGYRGILAEAMKGLAENPRAAAGWDGNLYERIVSEYPAEMDAPSFDTVVRAIAANELIAHCSLDGIVTIYNPERIGAAGSKALAIEEE